MPPCYLTAAPRDCRHRLCMVKQLGPGPRFCLLAARVGQASGSLFHANDVRRWRGRRFHIAM